MPSSTRTSSRRSSAAEPLASPTSPTPLPRPPVVPPVIDVMFSTDVANSFLAAASTTVAATPVMIASNLSVPSVVSTNSMPSGLTQLVVSHKHTGLDTPLFEPAFTFVDAKSWVNKILAPDFPISHLECILPDTSVLFDLRFGLLDEVSVPVVQMADRVDWRLLSKEDFCKRLLLAYNEVGSGLAISTTLIEKITDFGLEFSLCDASVDMKSALSLVLLQNLYPDASPAVLLECTKLLYKKLPDRPVNWRSKVELLSPVPCVTVKDFAARFLKMFAEARRFTLTAGTLGCVLSYGPETRQINRDSAARIPKRVPEPEPELSQKKAKTGILGSHGSCWGCGKVGHKKPDCQNAPHPDFNKAPLPWSTSPNGLAWALKGSTVLPYNRTLSGVAFVPPKGPPGRPSATQDKTTKSGSSVSSAKNGECKHHSHLWSLLKRRETTNLIPCAISTSLQGLENKNNRAEFLLDTGSLAGDFISEELVHLLKFDSFVLNNGNKSVCSGLNNNCLELNKYLNIYISFFNENLNKNTSVFIKVFLLKESPLDLIIGLESIKKYDILSMIPSLIRTTYVPLSVTPEIHATLLNSAERIFDNPFLDLNEIPEKVGSFEPFFERPYSNKDVLEDLHMTEEPKFRKKISDLCNKYKEIFSDELPKQPAKLKPFNIIVDELKWNVQANKMPPRTLSAEKQQIAREQIDMLLKSGIIEPSQATYYSQLLLVPKPTPGEFRFCVDYRNVNDCTESASFPIPNIDQAFRRIGLKKPRFFGTMDLTQGYHQAPVSKATRKYTTFITHSGLYQFTRLPFGPKRAPSYFQEQMATALTGLLYFICELYLDDILVYGRTEEEYLNNLERVFERLQSHGLRLKAKKCYFGFQEVEWIGKVVSSEGLTMSRTRIQDLLDFPKPTLSKQLKSFLGFVNYFRDFIRNQSIIVKPLNNLLKDYNRSTRIKWTTESLKAFDDIKESVKRIPTLYFVNEKDPITLCTDASDYGVGGYLFQTIDGKEIPIAFLSKSLSGPQTRWPTIQKEAYAIFYCCTQLEYLLRDRKFVILTDHKNLLYINSNSNPMIVRWKMSLSEFDITSIDYLPGKDNIVADGMSRFCADGTLETPQKVAPSVNISVPIIVPFSITAAEHAQIAKVHNSTVGHMGSSTTVSRLLKMGFTMKFIRSKVKLFIRECAFCQKNSAEKFLTNPQTFTTSTYNPMECLNIDFIGPFPDDGYILTVIDTFTRWVELYSTPDASAKSAVRCLIQHFGRFGSPSQIRSDGGPHFRAELTKQFLNSTGIQHCITLPYSSQENSIVERCNKEINKHLRALTFENTKLEDYKQALPFVQRILNTNISDRTKISSAELLFGKMIDLDVGLFISRKEVESIQAIPLHEYMEKLLTMQECLMAIARKRLLATDELHLSSNTNNQHQFEIDSFVLVRYRKQNPPSRLHTVWRGPMRVLRTEDSRYTLLDLITNKEKVYHVSDMKPFAFDPLNTNPQDIARRDYLEYFVDKILGHKGNPKVKTSLEFLVHWVNYDDDHDTWEPYTNLRDLDQLHDYLSKNNLKNLIPIKFRYKT